MIILKNKHAFMKGCTEMNTSQIAKLANVSRSTVSRVLNNYGNVPDSTREKVQAVINEHGYTPNHFARSLAGVPSNIIGIFIADINDTDSSEEWVGINSPYNMELLSNLINSLKTKGYTALVNIITDTSEFKNIEEVFKSQMISGAIFAGFPCEVKELNNIASKYNTVFIDQFSETDKQNESIKIVNCDNFKGGYLATEHLIKKGHTNILHIEGDNRLSSIKRKEGYLSAMKNIGNLKPNVITGLYKEDVAYLAAKEYLKANNKPTAIFVANDIMSLGVMKAIEELNYKDISVIGFDNLKVANWNKLNLTSFEVSLKEISKSAVELLFEKEARKIVHEPIFIEKNSVKNI